MGTYSIAEAKDRLSTLVKEAEQGEDVAITRHGKVVAYLRPAEERWRRLWQALRSAAGKGFELNESGLRDFGIDKRGPCAAADEGHGSLIRLCLAICLLARKRSREKLAFPPPPLL
jgi:prevent-host-death family protein